MNLTDVIRFLETKQRERFDVAMLTTNPGVSYDAKREAAEFDAPLLALRELRNLFCAEEGD